MAVRAYPRPRGSGNGACTPAGFLPLADAARWIEKNVAPGHRPHVSTLTRWILRGCRGRRLPARRIGAGRWYVHPIDLATFIRDANAGPTPAGASPAAMRSAREQLEQAALDSILRRPAP